MPNRLYHEESNPFVAALFDQYWPDGFFAQLTATSVTYAAAQTSYIPMFRADGKHALLELDPITITLSLAVVGAGGLNAAVGANRAYGVRMIARNDGTANLFGVRLGTTIGAAIPAGYEWYSRTLFPVWTDQASELHYWVHLGQGLFTIDTPGDVLANGTAQPNATAIPLATLGGGEEFVVTGIRQILFRVIAENAQATNRTVSIVEYDLLSNRTIWSQIVGQTAPATSAMEIEKWVNIAGVADTCLRYAWSGAVTTGLSLIPRMIQL